MKEDIVKFSFEWWVSFAAIWGGVLATFHALVSGIKAWLNRPRIHVTTNFTGSPEIGNQISIYNHSPIPINIYGYEIYRKKNGLVKKRTSILALRSGN